MSVKPAKAIEVFFSYSHADEELRDELEKHLSILKRQGVITGWHDRKIGAGREWEGEIDTHLNTADVILLLISADFLASDYCYDVEVKRAMERHEAGEARVIPVILRPCDWKGAAFGKLQALPKDAKPVTERLNRDKAFLNVAQGIRAAVEELAGPSVSPPSSVSTTPVDLKGTLTPPPTQESPLTKLWAAATSEQQQRGCYAEFGRIAKIVITFLIPLVIGGILIWSDVIPLVHPTPTPIIGILPTDTLTPRPTYTQTPIPPTPTATPSSGVGTKKAIQRAMWVWNPTDIINGSDTARSDFFAFCAAPHGDSSKAITTIHLSAREHLIGNDSQKAQLREFLVDAYNHGLRVEYLAGDPGWATPSHRANGEERCDAFVEFNQATDTITERFYRLHYDVEPYTLSDWETNYDIYRNQYTTLLRNCQEKIDTYNSDYNPNVTFACDIPCWYDTDSGAIGSVTSNREIQDIVDYVTIMDYRDDAANMISEAENEIKYGDSIGKQVVIGVETNDAAPEPESITFYEEGKQAMEAALATVLETYGSSPAFGGIAIHDYEGYRRLPTGPRVYVVSVSVQINDGEPVAYEEPITITLRAGDVLRLVNLRYCICPEAQPDGVAGEAYLFPHGKERYDIGLFTRGGPIGCGNVGNFEGSWIMEPGQHRVLIALFHYFDDAHDVDDRFYINLDVKP